MAERLWHAFGERRRLKAAISLSLLALAAFSVCLGEAYYSLALLTLPLVLVYPLERFHQYPNNNHLLDVLYLSLFTIAIASIIIVQSPVPKGYTDAFNHFRVARTVYQQGHITFYRSPSLGFPSLYIITTQISRLTSVPLTTVAAVFPIITTGISAVAFYIGARQILPTDADRLFASLLFITSWVFRFHIEFRTLNVATPLFIFGVFVFLLLLEGDSDVRFTVIFYTVSLGIGIAHFATYVFYLITLSTIVVVLVVYSIPFGPLREVLDTSDKRSPIDGIILISVVGIFLFLFMTYIGGSFRKLILTAVAGLEVPTAGAPSGTANNGLITGKAWAERLLRIETLRWVVRIGFGVAALRVGIRWLTNRNRNVAYILASAFVLGGIAVISLIGGVILNPGRILLYFAVFYAPIYALGFQTTKSRKWSAVMNCGKYLVVIFSVVVALTVFPFVPAGDSVHQNDSDSSYLNIDERDFKAQEFFREYANDRRPVRYRYGVDKEDPIQVLYQYTPNSTLSPTNPVAGFYIISQRRSSRYMTTGHSAMYDNGKVVIRSNV